MLRKIVSNTIDRLAAVSRARRLVSAGGLALAALVAAPLARADITTPMLSSLPWRSGASDGGFPCLADLRHRRSTPSTSTWPRRASPQMVQNSGSWVQHSARKAPLLVVSWPCCRRTTRASSPVRGRRLRRLLPPDRRQPAEAAGARASSCGWAGRRTSAPTATPGAWTPPTRSRPTSSAGATPPWRSRPAARGLNIEWTNAKKTQNKALSVAATCTRATTWSTYGACTTTTAARRRTRRRSGTSTTAPLQRRAVGPRRLAAVRAEPRQEAGRGRVGSAGSRGQRRALADDPVYIDNMYRFFRDNAGDIAYETYFNGMTGLHPLCPGTTYPSRPPSTSSTGASGSSRPRRAGRGRGE